MLVRLQKYLADAGVASRRKSEQLIEEGRVSVNGVLVTELGTKVDDECDTVVCNGKKIQKSGNLVYIMLNKPEGFVTTSKDQFDRQTVLDLVSGVKERVFPVGRLDYDTSGLLILTNDGALTFKLTHPSNEIEKVYEAKLFGRPDDFAITQFRRGIVIEGKETEPAKLEIIKNEEKYCNCRITIHEGRNRQIRKMCQAVRHPVSTLKRVSIGELSIGELPKGKYRYLTESEIEYLKSL